MTYKTMTSKYNSTCIACQNTIKVGEEINYSKEEGGAWHRVCELVPLPDKKELFFLSDGEGYGCVGWRIGEVVLNPQFGKTIVSYKKECKECKKEAMHSYPAICTYCNGDVQTIKIETPRENDAKFLYVLRAFARYFREDGMSFGVGDEAGYVYDATCRAATDEESLPLREAIADIQRKRDAETLRKEIAKFIKENGMFPVVEQPVGYRVTDRQNIYGGGDWFVVGDTEVWYIQNNGRDGDWWETNNIKTGGAGAMGWVVKRTDELMSKISEFESVLDPETIEKRRIDADSPQGQFKSFATKAKVSETVLNLFSKPLGGKIAPPQAVWVETDEVYLGQSLDKTKIYLALLTDSGEYGWWVGGRSTTTFEFETTVERQEYFNRFLPEWFSWEIADQIFGKTLAEIKETEFPIDRKGRFKLNDNWYSWASSVAAAIGAKIWTKHLVSDIEATFDVAVIHTTGSNDRGIQVWSDSKLTKGEFIGNQAQFLTEDVSLLISNVFGIDEWTDGKWEELLDVEKITERITLKSVENHNDSSELEKITVRLKSGEQRQYYLVTKAWWYLGEDGDAGEDLYLYKSQSNAVQKFNS